MKMPCLAFSALLAGCSIFGSTDRYPEVWAVPEVRVRITWPIAAGDPVIEEIRDLLEMTNIRIYDATDGQVRVAKFVVYPPNLLGEHESGVWNVIPTDTSAKSHGHATVGDPQYPGYFHSQIQGGSYTVDMSGGTGAHEWFHAYIGLIDEYKREDGSPAKCPESIVVRVLESSCIMYSSNRSELCRPDNHSDKTRQHDRRGMSCYEWLKKVMEEKGKGVIQIPDEHLIGPSDAPSPIIEFKFN